jgi:hypothetical protein
LPNIIVGDPPDIVFEILSAKIYQKPKGLVHQAQIGHDLHFVQSNKFIKRLDFNHQRIFDQNIDTKTLPNYATFIFDVDGFLAFYHKPLTAQFVSNYSFVDLFKQAGSKIAVDLVAAINDNFCQRFNVLHP